MSRYELSPKLADTKVVVGWDPPLNTFFAQVTSTTELDDGEPRVLFWIGTRPNEIWGIDMLKAHLFRFADIPDDIEHQLRLDSD